MLLSAHLYTLIRLSFIELNISVSLIYVVSQIVIKSEWMLISKLEMLHEAEEADGRQAARNVPWGGEIVMWS